MKFHEKKIIGSRIRIRENMLWTRYRTGVNPIIFWLSNLVWDFGLFFVSSLLLVMVILLLDTTHTYTANGKIYSLKQPLWVNSRSSKGEGVTLRPTSGGKTSMEKLLLLNLWGKTSWEKTLGALPPGAKTSGSKNLWSKNLWEQNLRDKTCGEKFFGQNVWVKVSWATSRGKSFGAKQIPGAKLQGQNLYFFASYETKTIIFRSWWNPSLDYYLVWNEHYSIFLHSQLFG